MGNLNNMTDDASNNKINELKLNWCVCIFLGCVLTISACLSELYALPKGQILALPVIVESEITKSGFGG